MASLVRYFWPCLEVICESINDRKKITYGQLSDKLGFSSRQTFSFTRVIVIDRSGSIAARSSRSRW